MFAVILLAALELVRAEVFVATNATVPEVEAAKMILRAQAVVAGGLDPVSNVTPKVALKWPRSGIVVGWQGSALIASVNSELKLRDWYDMPVRGEDEIVLRRLKDVYVVAANSPVGTCHAAGELLYRNGARFLHNGGDDGNEGIFLEFLKGLEGPQDFRYSPEAVTRRGFSDRLWYGVPKGIDRARYQIDKNKFAVFNGALGEGLIDGGRNKDGLGGESIQPPVNDFEKHPDWFPEIDGKRWRPSGGNWIVEGCWASKEFADWVIERNEKRLVKDGGEDMVMHIRLSTSDAGRRCECAKCRAMRAGYPDESSCYWDYVSHLNERQHALHPRMVVEPIAYIGGLAYPKLGNKVLHGLDAVDYCPYGRCFIHPYSDRTCPNNTVDLKRRNGWKASGLPVGDFDYLFDLFNPPMGLPVWKLAGEVVDSWKALNAPRRIPQMYSEFAVDRGCGHRSRIASYVFVRKLWNAEKSADEHLEEWCRCGLGEAAEVMLPFFWAEAVAWTNQPVHLTGCYNDPKGVARTYLDEKLVDMGETAFARGEELLKRAAEGGDARKRGLVRKQLAALAFEKEVFDAWVELRKKALSSSVAIPLKALGAGRDGFEELPRYQMKTRFPHIHGEDVTKSYAQFGRTKDALKIRVVSNDPFFKAENFVRRNFNTPKAIWRGLNPKIELFLRAPGQVGYHHLAVAADGAVYDALGTDPEAFDSEEWLVESEQRDGCWRLDFTIPLKMLGRREFASGEVFRAVVVNNATKRNAKTGEIESLSVGVPCNIYHDVMSGVELVVP